MNKKTEKYNDVLRYIAKVDPQVTAQDYLTELLTLLRDTGVVKQTSKSDRFVLGTKNIQKVFYPRLYTFINNENILTAKNLASENKILDLFMNGDAKGLKDTVKTYTKIIKNI